MGFKSVWLAVMVVVVSGGWAEGQISIFNVKDYGAVDGGKKDGAQVRMENGNRGMISLSLSRSIYVSISREHGLLSREKPTSFLSHGRSCTKQLLERNRCPLSLLIGHGILTRKNPMSSLCHSCTKQVRERSPMSCRELKRERTWASLQIGTIALSLSLSFLHQAG